MLLKQPPEVAEKAVPVNVGLQAGNLGGGRFFLLLAGEAQYLGIVALLLRTADFLRVFLGDGQLLLLVRAIFLQVVEHGLAGSIVLFPGHLCQVTVTYRRGLLPRLFQRGFLLAGQFALLRVLPLLLLGGKFGDLLVVVQADLAAPFLAALLQKVDFCLTVLHLELQKFRGTLLFRLFLLFGGIRVGLRMVTQVKLPADIQILLLQLARLGQIVVADFLRLTQRLLLRLLVVFRDQGLRVHLSV